MESGLGAGILSFWSACAWWEERLFIRCDAGIINYSRLACIISLPKSLGQRTYHQDPGVSRQGDPI